ncbi:hypothetical protein Golomagni_05847 [Golovinomyces magnicellulatus]|nr:hypothetical protein Golomagni_05847 [Golovinomyces magnicellulatus]
MAQGIISGGHLVDYFYLAAGLIAATFVATCIYNVTFHPLAKIPGSKLAAMTGLYEFWFDVVRDGTYLWQIERMHEKYGPIIRINPREVHIRDSQYYNSIYTAGARKVNKDAATVGAFAVPTSVAATVDHHHHRARRGYLNPYFSKRSILGMEPMMHERLGKLIERLEDLRQKNEVVTLDSAFSALTADIITERFYGENFDYLDIPDFKVVVTEAFLGVSLIFHLARFIPGLVSTLKKMPIPVIRMILPPVADLLELQEEMKQKILRSLADDEKENKGVIVAAIGDPDIPAPERQIDRLLDEGTVIIFAGTETSSRALSVGMFHLLNDKTHLHNLREELKGLPFRPDNDYTMAELEVLPYLTGVVHEALRLSFGPVSRLPRVATHEALQYGDYAIPPGTPVAQSTYFVHTDSSVYPNPHSFDPDRWTRAAKEGVALNRYLVNFTKGGRQCIGVQMAFTELYLTFARLVKTFEMDLHETSMEDVQIHHVRIVGYPKKAKGTSNPRGEIMVKVTGRVDH